MNPDSNAPTTPPPAGDEFEARVIALLLGELSEAEAATLRRTIEQDARLAALYDRLQHATALVRQAAAEPQEQTAEAPAPLKLSNDRRERLLAHFKTVGPKEFAQRPRRGVPWFIPLSAAAILVAMIGAALLRLEVRESRVVQERLDTIETVKAPWAFESKKKAGETPTPSELKPYLGRGRGETEWATEKRASAKPGATTPTAGLPAGGDKLSEKQIVFTDSRASGEKQLAAKAPVRAPARPAPEPAPRSKPAAAAQEVRNEPPQFGLPSGGKAADVDANQIETRAFQLGSARIEEPQITQSLAVPYDVLAQNATGPGDAGGIFDLTRGSVSGGRFGGGGGIGGGFNAGQREVAEVIGTNLTQPLQDEAHYFLHAAGINTAPPNPSLDNERMGRLMVRAKPHDSGAVGQFASNFDAGTAPPALQAPGVTPAEVATDLQATIEPPAPGLNGLLTVAPPAALASAHPAEPGVALRSDVSAERPGSTPKSSLSEVDKTAALGDYVVLGREFQKDQGRTAGRKDNLNRDNRDGFQKESVAKEQDAKIEPQQTAAEGLKRLLNLAKNDESKRAESVDRPLAPPPQEPPAPAKAAVPPPVPQPEIQTRDNAFSTFSLNVTDVSFKLAAASLEQGVLPEAGTVRSEEFINAFDYRDPEPPAGVRVAFAWERARYPFAHNRDLLRFSLKTAAAGRQPGRPLNVVLLLDNSGSMERADRVRIIHEALRLLAAELQPQDKFSVVTFARTAQLRADGVSGDQAGAVVEQLRGLTPQGGTNLEEAMNVAYQTALRHYLAAGVNRVVLLTDGAANLGSVDPETLKHKVEAHRKQGVALDCFGIGWEGYNDDLLEVLSRNGDGRYGFINTPEEAAGEFAGQLAGALRVAASDVKVQVEFNPARVTAYRQIGYARHQLAREQFRDNTVDAAEIGAAEAGNALYVAEVNPAGEGPLATVRVRYRAPGTADYREHEWTVPYTGSAPSLEQSSPAMRLAATAGAFSEWLLSSPYAAEVSPDRLLGCLAGVPEVYGADTRPKKLEWMIRQARSISGK